MGVDNVLYVFLTMANLVFAVTASFLMSRTARSIKTGVLRKFFFVNGVGYAAAAVMVSLFTYSDIFIEVGTRTEYETVAYLLLWVTMAVYLYAAHLVNVFYDEFTFTHD